MAKMGRPLKEIDEDNFKKLCTLQCTESEIASFFNCDEDTICNWCKRTYGLTFSDAFKRFSASGKVALRRIQFRHAEKNAAMAMFLGKNWLGQTDKVEQTIMEVEDLSPLVDLLKDEVNSEATFDEDKNTDG